MRSAAQSRLFREFLTGTSTNLGQRAEKGVSLAQPEETKDAAAEGTTGCALPSISIRHTEEFYIPTAHKNTPFVHLIPSTT